MTLCTSCSGHERFDVHDGDAFDRGADADRARRDAGQPRGFREQGVHLHAAFRARLAMQRGRGDELTALRQVSGQAHFNERRGADAEVRGGKLTAIRMLTKKFRREAKFILTPDS